MVFPFFSLQHVVARVAIKGILPGSADKYIVGIETGLCSACLRSMQNHLKCLAADRQILCITHLAAIAVYADTQIKIEKSVQNGITATRVCEVSGEKRVEEIARMLSGDAVSSVSLEHARTLLKSYGSFGG